MSRGGHIFLTASDGEDENDCVSEPVVIGLAPKTNTQTIIEFLQKVFDSAKNPGLCKPSEFLNIVVKYVSVNESSFKEYTFLHNLSCIAFKNLNIYPWVSACSIYLHQQDTPNTFVKSFTHLVKTGILDNMYDSFINTYHHELNFMIKHERDYFIDFFGLQTLKTGYLLKDPSQKIIETPQYMMLRVAIGIHFYASSMDILAKIQKSYDLMSRKLFTHATPTLFNSCTKNRQLLSCFLLGTDDSIEGLMQTTTDAAIISKFAGGEGIHVSNVRSHGTLIKSTNGQAAGLIPMCRTLECIARWFDQGGKRKGSISVYIEPWHPDIFEFLDLKRENGNDSLRARDLYYAIWVPDLFMRCVQNDEPWYLMDPHTCPGLTNVYGEAFDALYFEYTSQKKYKRQIKARDLWFQIIETQIETGIPYICFKDAANSKNNQCNLGTIKSSNLCTEIMEYSDDEEYACCTLASLNLPMFIINKSFDSDSFREAVFNVVENLNKIIDINYYPVEATRKSNKNHRPLGIGVQGLQDMFFKLGFPFDSPEARKINRFVFESLYFYAIRASCNLSQQDGAYLSILNSPIDKGMFQFDLWKDEPRETKSSLDWENLRKDVIKYGVRNSLLIALMPTQTTSSILGSTECFEPISNNVYVRKVLSGDHMIINKYLLKDLHNAKIWSDTLYQKIIQSRGSIQSISEIPSTIKKLYRTAYELPFQAIIDLAADRAPFVCQSQSMNLFFNDPDYEQITRALFYGWKMGLKTGSYYIRSKPKFEANAQQLVIEKPQKRMGVVECHDDVCVVCSS